MTGLAIVDCFAGGGGASNGIERALGRLHTELDSLIDYWSIEK